MNSLGQRDIKVDFHIATSEERDNYNKEIQKSGYLWRVITGTKELISGAVNIIALGVFRWDLQSVLNWGNNRDPYLNKCPLILSNVYTVWHPKVMSAILKGPRNDSAEDAHFTIPPEHPFFKFMQHYISNDLKYDDVVMICSADMASTYKRLLSGFFSKKNVSEHIKNIEEEASAFLDRWSSLPQPINVTDETRRFSCRIMTKEFLGCTGSYDEIYKATNTIIAHLTDLLVRRKTVSDGQIAEAKAVLLQAIEDAFQKAEDPSVHTVVKAMKEGGFSEVRIKAMIFMLFIAGQDSTATSFAHLILKMAQNSELQDKINQEIVEATSNGKTFPEACINSPLLNSAIMEGLRFLAPVPGIPRTTSANDSMLIIKDSKDDSEIARYFIPAKTPFFGMISFAGRNPAFFEKPNEFDPARFQSSNVPDWVTLPWHPFGVGVHSCPGRFLFQNESRIFAGLVATKYLLSTTIKGDPRQLAYFTNKMEYDVVVSVQKR